jgi:ElaA protein
MLQLRAAVFVVEQMCVFLDPDGRDPEPGAVHLWVEDAGQVVGCARVLREDEGSSIGRVVTAPSRRSEGIASAIVDRALDLAARPTVVSAQSPLIGWYAGFGFVAEGPEFLEDGIPHTRMVRTSEPTS